MIHSGQGSSWTKTQHFCMHDDIHSASNRQNRVENNCITNYLKGSSMHPHTLYRLCNTKNMCSIPLMVFYVCLALAWPPKHSSTCPPLYLWHVPARPTLYHGNKDDITFLAGQMDSNQGDFDTRLSNQDPGRIIVYQRFRSESLNKRGICECLLCKQIRRLTGRSQTILT